MKNVILFITHKWDSVVEEHYEKLKNDIKNRKDFDLFICYNNNNNEQINKGNVYYFNKKSVENDGFIMHYYWPGTTDFYGNNYEYSFMSFFKHYPDYNYYWIIEYDVIFNGNWNILFDAYEKDDTDFIASNLNKYEIYKDFWGKCGPMNFFDKYLIKYGNNRIKTFNPIFRISKKGLEVIQSIYNKREYGFFEEFLPTVIYNNSLKVSDFNKKGFVKGGGITKELDNTAATMRFMPEWNKNEIIENNILYHPVKK